MSSISNPKHYAHGCRAGEAVLPSTLRLDQLHGVRALAHAALVSVR